MAARDPFRIAGQVRLKAGREASVLRRHPWIYRGALAAPLPEGSAPLAVVSASGSPLAVALPGGSGGSLALRVMAFAGETWSREELRKRLAAALALRRALAIDSDAFRLVHAEGDRLPGLVVDRYGEVAVIESYERAWGAYLDELTRYLVEIGCRVVLARAGQGRGDRVAALHGEPPAGPLEILERAQRFPVDLQRGHKTGFYLDQRDNRRRFGELAGGREVLNLFSYSGGFAVAALAGGAASAVNVDASPAALDLARDAYRRNALRVADEHFLLGDAFTVARGLLAAGRRFDAVVVDPPSFVRRRAELAGGLRGYRDINLQAVRLLRPGGLLLTCSCSALVSEEQFGAALAAAALDAGRELTLLERRGAAPDHPISAACPETRHLQAWFCAVE
jgi:23S rRNA (cytosine1962-C5)-methyltransferase